MAPDPAKVDEYMKLAAERLRVSMNANPDRGRMDTDAARVWLDMARLQHERVRDHRALLNNPKES